MRAKPAFDYAKRMATETPSSVRPRDLAAQLGISEPYASQLLTGARVPSLSRAIELYDLCGLKFGPIKDKSDEQITTLREALAA